MLQECHVQLSGRKVWRLKAPSGCNEECPGKHVVDVLVDEGEMLCVSIDRLRHQTYLPFDPVDNRFSVDIAYDIEAFTNGTVAEGKEKGFLRQMGGMSKMGGAERGENEDGGDFEGGENGEDGEDGEGMMGDEDSILGYEEYAAFNFAGMSVVEQLLEMFDADEDGYLSKAESVNWWGGNAQELDEDEDEMGDGDGEDGGGGADAIEATWHFLDTNGDNKLSKAEIEAFLALSEMDGQEGGGGQGQGQDEL
jgi:hypothetical protein